LPLRTELGGRLADFESTALVHGVCAKSEVAVWELTEFLKKSKILGVVDREIAATAIAPDGRSVAVGGVDGSIYVWSVADGKRLLSDATGHQSEILDLAFSADGKRLASSGADSTVRIWDLDYPDMAELGCKKVGRNLSYEEWKEYVGEEFSYEITCPDYPSPLSADWALKGEQRRRPSRAWAEEQLQTFSW
jgi:WD40 repeat protein